MPLPVQKTVTAQERPHRLKVVRAAVAAALDALSHRHASGMAFPSHSALIGQYTRNVTVSSLVSCIFGRFSWHDFSGHYGRLKIANFYAFSF